MAYKALSCLPEMKSNEKVVRRIDVDFAVVDMRKYRRLVAMVHNLIDQLPPDNL